MSIRVYKGEDGFWKYVSEDTQEEQSCDSCSFMSVYLGIYSAYEVIVKIPVENQPNEQYHVFCKDYKIVNVVRTTIHSKMGSIWMSDANEFYII